VLIGLLHVQGENLGTGRTIRKVMGGGGGGKSKNKNRAGKTNKKNIRAPEIFEKKNSCRDISMGKIIS
jgi:hypothetical protein